MAVASVSGSEEVLEADGQRQRVESGTHAVPTRRKSPRRSREVTSGKPKLVDGSRIEVLWLDEAQWYSGTVVGSRWGKDEQGQPTLQHRVFYDQGDPGDRLHWHDLDSEQSGGGKGLIKFTYG